MNQSTGRTNLKDRVYRLIKNDILMGEIMPGEHLLETVMAEKYQVSRTPVREAFNKLEQEGHLQWVAKKGYQVTQLSHNDFLEIFFIRILLEKGAAQLAATRISTEEIKKLERYCQYYDEVMWSYNKQFHMTIAGASGNTRLVKAIDGTIDDVRRILMLDPYMNIVEAEGKYEHIRVIEALKKNDPEAAGLAMEAHLLSTRKRIHEAILE